MQFEGYPIEKWRAQFMGAIEVNEAEGLAMRTDRVVVMVVATRIRKSPIEVSDEEGIAMITRQNRIEHLAVLEGDLREKALSLLASGSERGFQETLLSTLERQDETVNVSGYTDVGDESLVTPPTPAALLEDDDIPRDEPEYFDVPPIADTSQPVGTGPVKQHGPVSNGDSGEGFKVAPTDFADLASVGTTSAPPDPAAPPVGEVVGQVRPGTRKDTVLQDFFDEEIPHE